MKRVTWSRFGALVTAATVAGVLLTTTAGAGLGANTRLIYFGAPPEVCPTGLYCGGGIDPATGLPIQGIEVYSPLTVTTTTATGKLVGYRLMIQNLGGQTLTHVVVLGGALAGLTTNPLFPPPTVGPSLPTGFTYDAVYQVSGPAPACTISSSSSTSPNDSLRCDFGNIKAGATPTIILVVMRTPTTSQLLSDPYRPQPWNELQLNEGSSSSGSNIDSFYAVGQELGITVTASLSSYVESFVAPPGGTLVNVDSFVATTSALAVTRVGVPARPNGDDSRIDVSGNATDSVTCATVYTCFGVDTLVTVTTPVNIVDGAGAPDVFGVVDPNDPTKWLVPPLQLDFRWDASEIPGKVNTRNLQVVHDGVVVSTFCATVPPTPGQLLPCRTAAVKFSDKDLGVTVYAPTNGSWKPGY